MGGASGSGTITLSYPFSLPGAPGEAFAVYGDLAFENALDAFGDGVKPVAAKRATVRTTAGIG